jgi:hypothetical protein
MREKLDRIYGEHSTIEYITVEIMLLLTLSIIGIGIYSLIIFW